MALSRCLEQHSPPQGRSTQYRSYVRPVGYPKTALVCGNPQCDLPGVIWLAPDECHDYQRGERIFSGPSNFTKMKADDAGLQQLGSR